jgi:hypothetical protein
MRSESCFANVAPLPASGRTQRHRLNAAATNKPTSGLHLDMISRISTDPRPCGYLTRRTGEGHCKSSYWH